MQKIVCFGEVLIDFLAQPQIQHDAPRQFLQFAGGAPANVAVAAAKLGANAYFAGMVGEDMFGDFLIQELRGNGVATDFIVRTDAAKTALAFVQLDEHGERHFSFYRPPAADLLFRPAHFADAAFSNTAIFHVCSNSLTEEAIAETTVLGMTRARANGAIVSLDLNLRPMLWSPGVDPRPRLWQVLLAADLVKLARNELDYLAAPYGSLPEGEQAVLTRLLKGKAQFVVVTDGAASMRWFTCNEQGELYSFDVKTTDTTAAGDAFVGGLLYWLAQHQFNGKRFAEFVSQPTMISQALRFASAVGALAVTRHGAFAAMPQLTEVEHLLQEK